MSRWPPKLVDLKAEVASHLLSGTYLDTRHAVERQALREITRLEVIYVLRNGFHEKRKDKFDEGHQAWNYAMRGKTLDKRDLRIIVSFDKASGMLIITAIEVGE